MQHVMCKNVDSTMFMHVSDCSKTQKICDKAVAEDSKLLKFVSD